MTTGGPLEGPWAKLGAIAGIIGTAAAIVFGIAQCSSTLGTNGATPSQTTSPTDPTDKPTSTATPPLGERKYLSDIPVVDQNSKSSTGGWEKGTRDINSEQFGHSLLMFAGCQNDDGGDYWIDLTIGTGWRQLSGKVGLTADSSVDSTGTWRVLDPLSGRELASGRITAGPGAPVAADLAGVTRVRLFMNNPNSPAQACGFIKIRTRLVWGDVELSK